MTYLLDTNIYISLYDRYYPKENFPSFWREFTTILNADIVIPKVVANENIQSEWFVNEYLKNHYQHKLLDQRLYVTEWQQVLEHIQASANYHDEALNSDRGWANLKIADGWLIAIAKKTGYTIVTDEVKNINLNQQHPAKNCKIPDIAQDLNVPCISMLEFFKEIDLRV